MDDSDVDYAIVIMCNLTNDSYITKHTNNYSHIKHCSSTPLLRQIDSSQHNDKKTVRFAPEVTMGEYDHQRHEQFLLRYQRVHSQRKQLRATNVVGSNVHEISEQLAREPLPASTLLEPVVRNRSVDKFRKQNLRRRKRSAVTRNGAH